MATFVTSDTHFGHANILRPEFCGAVRQFRHPYEMGDEIIRRWNARIGRDDTVYHLGDVFWRLPASVKLRLFHKLNGRKHLVLGNHDDLDDMERMGWASIAQSQVIMHRDMEVVMTHHPPTADERRRAFAAGNRTLWLHGHIHSMTPPEPPVMDVGVDAHDLKPWPLRELVALGHRWYDVKEAGELKMKRLFDESSRPVFGTA